MFKVSGIVVYLQYVEYKNNFILKLNIKAFSGKLQYIKKAFFFAFCIAIILYG